MTISVWISVKAEAWDVKTKIIYLSVFQIKNYQLASEEIQD